VSESILKRRKIDYRAVVTRARRALVLKRTYGKKTGGK